MSLSSLSFLTERVRFQESARGNPGTVRTPAEPTDRLRLSAVDLRRAATAAIQLLLVFLALWALLLVMRHLSYVLIPLVVAFLLTALLEPPTSWLCRHRMPRGLSVATVLTVGALAIGGLLTFVVLAVLNNLPQLQRSFAASIERVHRWLLHGPLGLNNNQLNQLFSQAQNWLSDHQQSLLSQALGAFNTLSWLLVGLLFALVTMVIFLADGERMWSRVLRPWRPETRELLDNAGTTAYQGVVVYVRTTALIALLDALGIGIGLLLLGVPLAMPLAALVFLGGFVPYVGAFASGIIAIGVSLVSNGPVTALVVAGLVVLVQTLEGHLLQPLLIGNFVRLHPLLVLVVIFIGGTEGGIAGALFAVPVVVALRGVVRAIAAHRERDSEAEASTESAR